jgi:hypothetical protein
MRFWVKIAVLNIFGVGFALVTIGLFMQRHVAECPRGNYYKFILLKAFCWT